MKKKKILAVIAAATMALSMVGCGSSGGGSSSSGVAIRISRLYGTTVSLPTHQQESLTKQPLTLTKILTM